MSLFFSPVSIGSIFDLMDTGIVEGAHLSHSIIDINIKNRNEQQMNPTMNSLNWWVYKLNIKNGVIIILHKCDWDAFDDEFSAFSIGTIAAIGLEADCVYCIDIGTNEFICNPTNETMIATVYN